MRAKRFAGVVGVLVASSLALTACGGQEQSVPETVTHDDMPLLAYTRPNTPEENNRLMRKQQDTILVCMQEHGFEFEPTYELPETTPAPGADLDQKSKEFAQTYGYGVFNNPFGTNGPLGVIMGEPVVAENPNEQYYNSLDAEQQAAYMEALNGGLGCVNQANDSVYRTNPWDKEEFQPIVNNMKSVYSQTQSDPKTVELLEAWVTCMADAGYPGLRNPGSAHETFTAEFGMMQQQYIAENPPSRGQEVGTFDLESPEAQDALARELAQATSDWECRNANDFDHEMLRTQYKYEQAFIAENRKELEAFRDALTAWREQ